jgi:hypothetical protein
MEKSKSKKKKRDIKSIIPYILILIAIILLALFLINHVFSYYNIYRNHQGYFKNNTSVQIESWMTPHTILRHFNISEEDLFKELNISNNNGNLRTPLEQICKKEQIDCPLLIGRLNSLLK